MSNFFITSLVFLCLNIAAKESFAPGKYIDKDFDSYGIDFIDNNCTNCHDDDKSDGNLNLLDLEAVNETNIGLWKSIWAQVAHCPSP